MISYIIIGVFGFIVMGGTAFINFSPEFGGTHTKADIDRYEKSENYKEGIFHNIIPVNLDMKLKDMASLTYEYIFNAKERAPKIVPSIEKLNVDSFFENQNGFSFTWFGHSTLLLNLDGKAILIDPMFSDVPAPHPALGNSRYQKELPTDVDQLPNIDYVLISHDHYDHLDYKSIQKLKDKASKFFVPLGLGRHLIDWGVPQTAVKEFDWWEELKVNEFNFALTPARHFSGRGLTNRCSTLWGSWVIQSKNNNIYFSGDSGYGGHFKQIGEQFGPFDLAFLECGQYNELWPDVHMMPEETVQAAKDLNTKSMMPIHWGSFTLALHTWTDPIERIIIEAKKMGIPIIAPKIGEIVKIDQVIPSINNWWAQNK